MSNKLIVHETWTGTPMKVEKKYCWKVVMESSLYTGKFISNQVYDSPEDAVTTFNEICKIDPILISIKLDE
jgi:hypothetical protein